MIGNPSLESDGHVPNMVAIVDSLAPTSDQGDPGQRAMTDDVEDIARADTATIIQQTPGTVCGYPSITVAYTIHGMESMALIVTSSSKDRKAWRVRLNFLSHDPHNRRWIEDTQAITTGVAITEEH